MEFIQYSTRERIASITLNRPEKRNALNFQMVSELREALKMAAQDKQVKVIILKAAGKVFCAGIDLAYMKQLESLEENLKDAHRLQELFYNIYTLEKIVIAQIEGHAMGGGCGLATVCDFSFTVPTAKFGYPEIKVGFVPAIVKVFLIRKIGEGKARALLLTGDLIAAAQAVDDGLVNYVVPAHQLEESVNTFAQKLIKNNSTQAMQLTKEMLAHLPAESLEKGLAYAAAMNTKARFTEDCRAGIEAFLHKKTTTW